MQTGVQRPLLSKHEHCMKANKRNESLFVNVPRSCYIAHIQALLLCCQLGQS